MRTWIYSALVRALKTFCQTAVAMIGTTVYFEDVNFHLVISAAALAFVLSVLTSLAGLPEVDETEETEEE